MKHDENNMKPIKELTEIQQAHRLRELIKGHWDEPHDKWQTHLPGLNQDERDVLREIIHQWLTILIEEQKEQQQEQQR